MSTSNARQPVPFWTICHEELKEILARPARDPRIKQSLEELETRLETHRQTLEELENTRKELHKKYQNARKQKRDGLKGELRKADRALEEAHQKATQEVRDQALRMDLVGLAFSGGGIRSASFNLGVLQGIQDEALLRHVDYLSTVSGGGYVGGYFSSLLSRENATLDPDKFPLRPKETGEQPPAVLKMVRGGTYLNRPLQFADRYLIGLFYNSVAFFGGVVFLCALLAYLWRWLDTPPVHTWLTWVSGGRLLDYNRPFLPCLIPFGLWLVGWGALYWKWLIEETIRSSARLAVEAAILVLLLGLAGGLHVTHVLDNEQLGFSGWWLYSFFWALPVIWLLAVLLQYWRAAVRKVREANVWLIACTGVFFLVGWAVWFGNPHINFLTPAQQELRQPVDKQLSERDPEEQPPVVPGSTEQPHAVPRLYLSDHQSLLLPFFLVRQVVTPPSSGQRLACVL